MDKSTLFKKNKKDLIEIAKSYKLKNLSSKTKDELIDAILNHLKSSKDPEDKETLVSDTLEEIKTLRIDIQNIDGLKYLETIENGTIDLILTDPPYIISKDSGMDEHYNKIKLNEENEIEYIKSEEEWEAYKLENEIDDDDKKR